MGATTEVKAKVCSVCGVDCSKLERFKDAATGLYTCGPCYKKRAAIAPEVVPPVESGPIALVDEAPPVWLSDFTPPEVKKCPKCQALLSPGQEACVACGFDPR